MFAPRDFSNGTQQASGSVLPVARVLLAGNRSQTPDRIRRGPENLQQEKSDLVARMETLMELALGKLYSESAVQSGITTDIADLLFASIPYRIMPDAHRPIYQEIAQRDADLYRRLEQAGFLLDFGDDGSSLFMKYLRRGSGYYIDVGASDLIADGRIQLHSGVSIERIESNAVVLTDGVVLPADLIVYATGYGSMNGWAASLISQEVADRVGKCWGLGSNTRKDPGPWEGKCATCGSRRSSRVCGSMAATCTNRGTIRCTWPCSSRRGWKDCPLRCMASLKLTTVPESGAESVPPASR